jgi:Domain of unknown function (DUF4159)
MTFRWLLIPAAACGLLLSAPGPAPARPKTDPLVEKVRKAIQDGIKYLRSKQLEDGSWEIDVYGRTRAHGGWTSMALLALLNAGVPPDDTTVKKGLEYLRKQEPKYVYVRALQAMVFVEAGQKEDSERIQQNVDWLIKARIKEGGDLVGWTYTQSRSAADNSNTQYALLALHAGRTAGAKIPKQIWREIQAFYTRTQQPAGGWIYAKHHNNRPYLTMDAAGLCGLLISGMDVDTGREEFVGKGKVKDCGKYKENTAVRKALKYLQDEYQINFKDAAYYNLYGIERVGRLSGLRFLGAHDWYREGCELLTGSSPDKDKDDLKQAADGSWPAKGVRFDQWPVINTSFALLFLSKGRTPVLVSKIVHGPDQDWNNDRNDVKHLVEFASKELFKKQPLAWQAFNLFRGYEGRPTGESPEEKKSGVVSELLQSPVAFFNGHQAPEFKEVEIEMLKEYIDNGGFVVAEACCGRPAFDQGFKRLLTELFPNGAKLVDLEANHPIYKAFFSIDPRVFPLKGVKSGCKTVMIYSPTDLSCYWEANRFDDKFQDGRGKMAFRLGANIIAYATGLEKPKPRLTEKALINSTNEKSFTRRHYFRAAQIRHGPDWEPAPRAMAILADALYKDAALNVDKTKKGIAVNDANIVDYKFLYMHGNTPFAFKDEDLKLLRFNLTTGGLLLADACCGSEKFDESFREFMKVLFPKHKLEKIPVKKEELFSKELNGEKLDESNIQARIKKPGGGKGDGEYRSMAPSLEGIKIDNRWVVIYSKYDIGCALENHQSTDCLGYDHESALKLAKAAVLYALKR